MDERAGFACRRGELGRPKRYSMALVGVAVAVAVVVLVMGVLGPLKGSVVTVTWSFAVWAAGVVDSEL